MVSHAVGRSARPKRGWRCGLGLAASLSFLFLSVTVALPASEALAQQTGKSQRNVKQPVAPKPADIDRNGVLILVRSALIALDQANQTGNYTVLRDLGAPALQAKTAAQLADIFASQRKQGLDLAGVAVLEPQLTLLPQIEPNGMLHLAGFFPSVPLQMNFEMLFAPADHRWKLFGISVNFDNGAPKAPEVPSPAEPEAPAEMPRAPAAVISIDQPKKQ